MAKTLVIVESPGKIKKIREYLGADYDVQASVGHIRDLPTSREQVPERIAAEPWARLGVNPHTFQPYYIVTPEKKAVAQKLRAAHKAAQRTLLAMDQDREGEAIAWHVAQVLGEQNPQRITFTEITKAALQEAVKHPRPINLQLVGAQESRRILDRLVGFEVSPLLWKSIGPRLSAGRVQSATLFLLVQREHERMAFQKSEYWLLRCDCTPNLPEASKQGFVATVFHLKTKAQPAGQLLAKASDFDASGKLKEGANVLQLSAEQAQLTQDFLDGKVATVVGREVKEVVSKPKPPFVTSTLQQEGERLKMDVEQVMKLAQQLYEGGNITYMRTDSQALSDEALQAARQQVQHLFGADALPPQPRQYASKDKNAQEAHEAIRPSGTTFRTPKETGLSGPLLALYTAIYKRTVASQMKDSLYEQTKLTLQCGPALLSATGKVLTFAGHTKLAEQEDKPDTQSSKKADDSDIQEQALPPLQVGDTVQLASRPPELKKTSAPTRYTQASLIKAMKSAGIGRPATYQHTITTLDKRGYTVLQGKYLHVSALGLLVGHYLQSQLEKLIHKEFTAQMEAELDQIARGGHSRVEYLGRIWTQQLWPQIQRAQRQAPVLNLPHLQGVQLRAFREQVQLQRGAQVAVIPAQALLAELAEADLEEIFAHGWQEPKAKRPRGAGSKAKGAQAKSATKGAASKGRKTQSTST